MEKGSVFTKGWQSDARKLHILVFIATLSIAFLIFKPRTLHPSPEHTAILQRCSRLKQTPGVPPHFHQREQSDRFESGTKATLIKNAQIFTGTEVVHGDILIDKGQPRARRRIVRS